uniref:Major facilitator superfamily (MFS) profile domain-containing protein n=1 Tax=Peronospora matthiolae TaxID=2874970 RepID=A0AAV1TEZ4_9STRA
MHCSPQPPERRELCSLPSPSLTPRHSAYVCIDDVQVDTLATCKYDLPVDPEEFDRATVIKPTSLLRPHMRIFYLSWISAITGFFGWYAIPPLMPVIKTQLGLTDGQVLNSDIASTASTILSRIASGPVLDCYGPQVVQSTVLWLGAIPVICAAFVSSATSLVLVRFFIGLVGCVFVSSQYWTTITFARNVAGTANAITGGLGVSGIGFAFLVLPFIYEAITSRGHVSADLGWRLTIALPAVLMVIMGTVIRFAVDSCPTGDFQKLMQMKRQAEQDSRALPARTSVSGSLTMVRPVTPTTGGVQSVPKPPMTMLQSFKIVLTDVNVLVMIAQYAAAFGTELQLNNMGALYFHTQFPQEGCLPTDSNLCYMLSTTNAATVASSFGLMNIFARALGGLASDSLNSRLGMRGRKRVQFTLLCTLGLLVITLSQLESLGACIALYVLVAIAAQATGGSTYGIVPYLSEQHTGTVNGLVGAGGNLGGVVYGIIFRSTEGYSSGLLYMGIIILACALLTLLLRFSSSEHKPTTNAANRSSSGVYKRSHSTVHVELESDVYTKQ